MTTIPPVKQRNPITEQAYRKQLALQVYLPLGLLLTLLAVAIAVFWTGGSGDFSAWADIGLILLLIPLMLVGLLLLGLLGSLVYGLWFVIGWLPYPARKGQDLFVQAEGIAEKGADLAVKPFLIPAAVLAALRVGFEYLLGIFRSPEG